MEELANEQDFKPDDEAQMKKWMDDNSQAIVKRSQDLQQEFFHKFQENREVIVKVLAARIWGEVRRRDINLQVNQGIDDAFR
jgi:hypothetical protein